MGKRIVFFSLTLASLAWIGFIITQVFYRPASLMLCILTVGWPFYYGILFGITYLIAQQAKEPKPLMQLPAVVERVIPWTRRRTFRVSIATAALIFFPLLAFLMSMCTAYTTIRYHR